MTFWSFSCIIATEIPDCGHQVGANWMANLRWADKEPTMHFL